MDTTPVPAGIQVKDVWPGGPPKQQACAPKDVITAIDGRNVASTRRARHPQPDLVGLARRATSSN